MNLRNWIKHFAAVLAVVPMLALVGADQPDSLQVTVVQGISAPFGLKPRNLTFPGVGLMQTILVKPGDVVKAGQELASQDLDLENFELKILESKAHSTAQVDAATLDRDAKKIESENKKKAFDQNAASFPEMEEARLAYEKSEIGIVYAKEEHEQDQMKLQEQIKKIEKMKLVSPVDGVVEKINIQIGEVVDPNKPDGVLTVVTNSPLWVDMHVQSALAKKLKVGDVLKASYGEDDTDKNVYSGPIIFISPIIDAASGTRTVRMELENKENKPPGMAMNVQLPFKN